MKRAPMFDVMMMMVFLKFTRLPRPSVRWPSSNTCSRMLKMSGCALSISSSSTTEYGFRFTFSVSWPPSSRPTDRARDGRDGFFLADDALVELSLHAQQLVALVLIDRRHRHAGPLGHDLVDLGLADDDFARAGLHV